MKSEPLLKPAPERRSDSRASEPQVIRVGLLGFGTVGRGVYQMLRDNGEEIARKVGCPLEIARIGVRDPKKPRSLPAQLFTDDIESILDDPTIDVIAEVIGGLEPAGRYVEKALRGGKHVVTANKELIAKDGSRLVHLAKARQLDLHYEAAVGGGIPLVQPLKHQLAGNDVIQLIGILNGTTNYILTRMTLHNATLEEALAEAQAHGYAEADPTSDIEGHDTAYKIAILGSIACGKQIPVEGVYREGIGKVSGEDVRYASRLGYVIKLVGYAEPMGPNAVLVRVHPSLIPKDHPLASVNDVYNALWIHGDFVGDVMLSGKGAGSEPTASAVVGDLLDIGRNIRVGGPGSAIPYDVGIESASIEQLITAYYVRLIVKDRPKVLGIVALEFGEFEVSLSAMEMRVLDPEKELGEIVFLTHRCLEANFRQAIARISRLDVVVEVCGWIRVESPDA